MRLIKREELAKGVADRWYETYLDWRGVWLFGDDKRAIYANLIALGSNPSADDVDAAIGNDSWTQCRCNECSQCFEVVIEVGEKPDYESATAKLCKRCVTNALGWFDED